MKLLVSLFAPAMLAVVGGEAAAGERMSASCINTGPSSSEPPGDRAGHATHPAGPRRYTVQALLDD